MIVSASRRTDIPAFYSEWVVNRLKEGFVLVRNPFRPHQISRISLKPDTLDAIVFWTKNAQPMMDSLDCIDEMGIPYYFQYTITPHGRDVEPYVPDISAACLNFRELSGRLGKQRVIWRYDPVILNDRFTVAWHTRAFSKLCRQLGGYTETCIFSFADRYAKTDRNAKALAISDCKGGQAEEIAENFSGIASSCGIGLKTCCEAADLSRYSIGHASCIDKNILESILGCSLKVKADRNQRRNCGCFQSIDIGTYDTCLHGCAYCYATYSFARAKKNAAIHDVHSPLLIGRPTEADIVTVRSVKSFRE